MVVPAAAAVDTVVLLRVAMAEERRAGLIWVRSLVAKRTETVEETAVTDVNRAP